MSKAACCLTSFNLASTCTKISVSLETCQDTASTRHEPAEKRRAALPQSLRTPPDLRSCDESYSCGRDKSGNSPSRCRILLTRGRTFDREIRPHASTCAWKCRCRFLASP